MIQVRRLRAERIGTSERKPQTFGEGRTCLVCPTILSTFNPSDRCWEHRLRQHIRVRGKAA